ncbi:hypothetical protein ASG36_05700 [Geodermatophilus sp. Leaf369]|uniref:hypothetical protein n=1 Tax=Geodermatophilus sp. Leaf369 TaxID=1736354 RepID=UPI0007014C40|nr:hypothetical protein [Geodermatophilus sp. Leaf369]KQS60422.1 hypothetical protein ASG36_05700 [Geodermatophilus sp. Leaf369]
MEYVWHVVGSMLVGGAVLVARDAIGRSRHRRHQAGGAVRCPGRLGVGGARPRRGRLQLAGSGVRWTGGPVDPPVVLTGAVVLAHTPDATPRRWQDVDDEGLLHLALPDGRTATLRLRTRDVPTVATALASDARDGLPALRPTGWGVRRWAVGLLAVVGLWFAAWGWLVASGETVQATVSAPGSSPGLCQVRWPAPGGGDDSAEVDCDDPPVGSRVTVWAVGPPFVGEAVDPFYNTLGVVLVGGVVALPALVHVGRRAVRRGPAAPGPVPWEALRVDLRELGGADLAAGPGESPSDVARRLSPHGLRRVPPDGWESTRRPDGAQVPGVPVRVAQTLWTPVTGLGAGVALASAISGSTALVVGGLLLSGGATAWALPRALATWRQAVAVHRAAVVPAVPAAGVLTANPTGAPLVVLVRSDGTATAVPLVTPLPVGTAAAFAAGAGADLRVRGGSALGDTTVLALPDGRLLLPAGRTEALDRSGLHAALAVPPLLPEDRWADDDPGDDEPGHDEPGPRPR